MAIYVWLGLTGNTPGFLARLPNSIASLFNFIMVKLGGGQTNLYSRVYGGSQQGFLSNCRVSPRYFAFLSYWAVCRVYFDLFSWRRIVYVLTTFLRLYENRPYCGSRSEIDNIWLSILSCSLTRKINHATDLLWMLLHLWFSERFDVRPDYNCGRHEVLWFLMTD